MDTGKLINFIKFGIFAAVLMPLVKNTNFYFPYVGPKSLYFMAVAELVFFSWVVLAWKCESYRPDFKNPLVVAVLAFLAVNFISAVFGANFSTSFWSKFERMSGVLMFIHLTAFLIAASSVMARADWRRLFGASVAVALFVGISALFDKSIGANGGGLIGNDSFWGTYILFNAFFALYLFVCDDLKNSKLKYLAGAAFLVLTACLMVEGTSYIRAVIEGRNASEMGLVKNMFNHGARAAKICLLGGLGLFALLRFLFSKNKTVRIFCRAALLAGMGGLLAAAALTLQPGSEVYQSMVSRFGEGTIRGRLVVWETGWKGFLERPLLGWGPENFNLVFARYYNPCIGSPECSGETWFDRAHNVVVDTLAETGIIGLVAYLAVFAAALWLLWRPVFKKGEGLPQAAAFTALFAAYFVQNLTVFDMALSYLMFYLCLAFIISDSKTSAVANRPRQISAAPQAALAAIAGMVCFFLFVVGPFWTDCNTVAAAKAPYNGDQKIDLYKKSLGASPMGKYQIRMFFAAQWISALQDPTIIKKLDAGAAQKVFAYLSQELEKSRTESPYDFQARLRLAQLYNAWGFWDESKLALAEEVLNEARVLSPQNQQYYIELAQTRIEQGDKAAALELVRQAYDLYPAQPQAAAVLKKLEAMNTTSTEAVPAETGK